MANWLDSHCHILSKEFENELLEIRKRSYNNNVKELLVVCCTKEEAEKSFNITNVDDLYFATGIHPEDVNKTSDKELFELEELLKSKHFCALGEIGLDYHWDKENKEKQKEIFIKQIELANKYNLPILIHSRDATLDTYEILKTYPVKKTGIMHCYSGSYDMAKCYMNLGFYISFSGVVTFKNVKDAKIVAEKMPLNRLLIETDCPYMAPTPFRGKRNEPMYVKYIGEEISKIRNIEEEVLQKAINENFHRLFDN